MEPITRIIEGRDPGDEDDGSRVIDEETGETKSTRNAKLLAASKPPCAQDDYVSRQVEKIVSGITKPTTAPDHDEAEG